MVWLAAHLGLVLAVVADGPTHEAQYFSERFVDVLGTTHPPHSHTHPHHTQLLFCDPFRLALLSTLPRASQITTVCEVTHLLACGHACEARNTVVIAPIQPAVPSCATSHTPLQHNHTVVSSVAYSSHYGDWLAMRCSPLRWIPAHLTDHVAAIECALLSPLSLLRP